MGVPTILTFFSLLHSHPRGQIATESTSESSKGGVRALFSFRTPSTLFPPSAIISLTDDNSTFFLSRPADFGPSLTANGLSGQLWVGSGFGDEGIGRGGADDGAEGELGCSDVPGWEDGNQQYRKENTADQGSSSREGTKTESSGSQEKTIDTRSYSSEEPSEDDGTDDYLHHPLPSSPVAKPVTPELPTQHPPPEKGQSSTHADIQSLQESAEISGKVVLLSRGGCGFLEKVKWAQRRGATALIVGDHTRGAPLITMYARGDTSNVTIPSLFTSHTTAHLLASLIPLDSSTEDVELVEADGTRSKGRGDQKAKGSNDGPTFTSAPSAKATGMPSISSRNRLGEAKGTHQGAKRGPKQKQKQRRGWLSSIFGGDPQSHALGKTEDSRRPPTSGRLDWFNERWTNEEVNGRVANSDKVKKPADNGRAKVETSSQDHGKTGSQSSSSDDFVIGVQDWRDPDLAAKPSSTSQSTTRTQSTARTPLASKALYNAGALADQKLDTALRGGSITPGSGRYNDPANVAEWQDKSQKATDTQDHKQASTDSKGAPAARPVTMDHFADFSDEEHEGLWVTLTPTTMSTSPFFDTLLVLVVSPLVTLTVVYALLLLRSRIRRRRWRAPKSVVDRLPTRIYHTMSYGSTTSSSRLATPHTSSPTSPLLHPCSRTSSARSRPRSATATGVGDATSASLDRVNSINAPQHEKQAPLTKAKRKYHAKQIECVVCLEEYVDGESRVMSLPCGHEFHADCM